MNKTTSINKGTRYEQDDTLCRICLWHALSRAMTRISQWHALSRADAERLSTATLSIECGVGWQGSWLDSKTNLACRINKLGLTHVQHVSTPWLDTYTTLAHKHWGGCRVWTWRATENQCSLRVQSLDQTRAIHVTHRARAVVLIYHVTHQ